MQINRIIIAVKDGVISLANPLPEGWELEIHDYDSAQAYLMMNHSKAEEQQISIYQDDLGQPFMTAVLDNKQANWGMKPSVKTQPIPSFNNLETKEI